MLIAIYHMLSEGTDFHDLGSGYYNQFNKERKANSLMKKLRHHRTMGAAGFSGSFAPIVQYEKWEIHPVFPHFQYFRSGQNLSPNPFAPLCGDALKELGFEVTVATPVLTS